MKYDYGNSTETRSDSGVSCLLVELSMARKRQMFVGWESMPCLTTSLRSSSDEVDVPTLLFCSSRPNRFADALCGQCRARVRLRSGRARMRRN